MYDDDDDDGAKQARVTSKRNVAKMCLLAFPRKSARICLSGYELKYHRTDLAYKFRYSRILLNIYRPISSFCYNLAKPMGQG